MFHPTNKQSQVYCVIVQKRFFFLFFFCDIRVFVPSFFSSFFFSSLFFFISSFFPSPYVTSVSGQIVKRNLDVCGRFFFFFWSESTRFRFLKRINRRLNRCSRLGADERTNDRVISDRWRCAIRQLYIRSCSASNPIFLRSEEEGEFIGDSFFFFLLHLIFKKQT